MATCSEELEEVAGVEDRSMQDGRTGLLGVVKPSVEGCSPAETRALLRHSSHPTERGSSQQPLHRTCTPGPRNTPGVDAIVVLSASFPQSRSTGRRFGCSYRFSMSLLFAVGFWAFICDKVGIRNMDWPEITMLERREELYQEVDS